jgi:DNA-binding NarL/FixJ family response regulator
VVGEAPDGPSALLAVAALDPDVVVLDVQLPGLDGFDVAERLLAADPTLRIVLVSSRERSDYGGRIEASGALGFVTKGDLSGDVLERMLE